MLARTPKMPSKSVPYTELLRIPPKPASLANAESALEQAVTARQSAQAIHIEVLQQFRAMVPGMPPTISAREVDEAGAKLRTTFDTEQLALIDRDTERANYDAAIRAQLDEGLDGLRLELLTIANKLEEVLSHGVALHAAAAAARFNLHDRLPLLCREMHGSTVAIIRRNAR